MGKKRQAKMPREKYQVGRMGLGRRILLLGGSLFLVAPALVGNLQAQQVPIPHTATEVPGPAAGPLTKAYVQMVGRMAYVWGWPLVYVHNQRTQLTNVPETGLLAGVMPISPMNQVGMLTGYIDPGEVFIADPNQDVVYGLGYLSLERNPSSFKCPTLATVSGRSRCTTHAPTR